MGFISRFVGPVLPLLLLLACSVASLPPQALRIRLPSQKPGSSSEHAAEPLLRRLVDEVWQRRAQGDSTELDVVVSNHQLANVSALLDAYGLESRALAGVWNNCRQPTVPAGNKANPPSWSPGEDFFADYRPLSDIYLFLEHLRAQQPSLVSIFTVGTSWEGRQISGMKISAPSVTGGKNQKPMIYLEAGIHSREWIAHTSALYIADQLVQSFSQQSGAGGSGRRLVASDDAAALMALLEHFEFVIVPAVNVDGYVYTWEYDRMWRKTRSDRARCGGSPGGVDPNRNWGYHWRDTDSASYERDMSDACSSVYAGPSAFSEPEVKAVADFLLGQPPRSIAAFIDFHSYAQALLPPWGYKTESAPDEPFQSEICELMVNAMKQATGVSYEWGANFFPSDPGTGPDWAYGQLGVVSSMTIELRDTGSSGFCLPKAQIVDVGRETLAAVRAMSERLKEKELEEMASGAIAPGEGASFYGGSGGGVMNEQQTWSDSGRKMWRQGRLLPVLVVLPVVLIACYIQRKRTRAAQAEVDRRRGRVRGGRRGRPNGRVGVPMSDIDEEGELRLAASVGAADSPGTSPTAAPASASASRLSPMSMSDDLEGDSERASEIELAAVPSVSASVAPPVAVGTEQQIAQREADGGSADHGMVL